jgi:dipeptidyl-peptidase 4
VYAEELGVRSNYFWSPDGHKEIVYLHMDETKVPTYPITDWMPTHPTVDPGEIPEGGGSESGGEAGRRRHRDKAKTFAGSLGHQRCGFLHPAVWLGQRGSDLGSGAESGAKTRQTCIFVDAKTGKSRMVFSETTPGLMDGF